MSDAGEEEGTKVPVAPRETLSADFDKQYNLSVHSEKFSFGLVAVPNEGEAADVDLSCVIFRKDGTVSGVAYYDSPSAAGGAVRHCGDNLKGSVDESTDAEVVHVVPGLLPDDCDLMMFTVTGSRLAALSALKLTTYMKEKGKKKEDVVACDLLAHVKGVSARCALAVYRTGNGWIALYPSEGNADGADAAHWGALVPKIKTIASGLKSLASAGNFAGPDGSEAVPVQAKEADRNVADAATFDPLAPVAKPAPMESWPAPATASSNAESSKQAPARVRVDIGWSTWADDAEGFDPQYTLLFTAANGEAVECGEEQGVVQGIQGPPEEEEEAAAEEDDEAGAKPDEVHPVRKGQDTDPHGFPIKDSYYITIASLPTQVKNITVQVSNFGGGGLGNMKSLHARLCDATDADPLRHRDLFAISVPNAKGASANRSVAVLGRLYKEYAGTAYWQLRSGAAEPLRAYIACGNDDKVRDVLKAVRDEYCGNLDLERALAKALEDEEAGEEGVVKPKLNAFVWRVRALGMFDKADDAEAYAEVESKRVAQYEGAYNAMGRRECACAKVVYDNNDCFIGEYKNDLRDGHGMYIFANKGAYAGEYSAGLRHGHGVMVMPDGGSYRGAFEKDKFHGHGRYEYTDGSCYEGAWSKGKKHGLGVYWDKHGGCMNGTWQTGVLTGQGTYSQPGYRLHAAYTKGVPEGASKFAVAAFRTIGQPSLPKAAVAYITNPVGPVLTHEGEYGIPAGAADEPQRDEDGNPIEDEEKPKMPAYPDYKGLTFTAATASPEAGENMVYPPEQIEVPPCVKAPRFDMVRGVMEPSAAAA